MTKKEFTKQVFIFAWFRICDLYNALICKDDDEYLDLFHNRDIRHAKLNPLPEPPSRDLSTDEFVARADKFLDELTGEDLK